MNIRVPLKDWKRFLRFVRTYESDNGCWLWTGYKDKKGYGQFWFEGHAWWAHRFSYTAQVGSIPGGMTIEHKCRNPSCIRPNHLIVVDRQANSRNGYRMRGKEVVMIDGVAYESAPF